MAGQRASAAKPGGRAVRTPAAGRPSIRRTTVDRRHLALVLLLMLGIPLHSMVSLLVDVHQAAHLVSLAADHAASADSHGHDHGHADHRHEDRVGHRDDDGAHPSSTHELDPDHRQGSHGLMHQIGNVVYATTESDTSAFAPLDNGNTPSGPPSAPAIRTYLGVPLRPPIA